MACSCPRVECPWPRVTCLAQSGRDRRIHFRGQPVGRGVLRPPLAYLCPHVASSSADVYGFRAHVDCEFAVTYGFCACASPQLPPVTGFCTHCFGTRPLRAPPCAFEAPRCAAAHGCCAERRRPHALITCSSASRAPFVPPRSCTVKESPGTLFYGTTQTRTCTSIHKGGKLLARAFIPGGVCNWQLKGGE